jgi:hypothetical protein
LRKLAWIAVALVATAACSTVKKVVVKDVPLEEQEIILKEYKDRFVWTRSVIEDMGEGGSIPRDEKVKIVDVGLVLNGSVTLETLKKKNRIVHGLEIERPLNKAKIDARLAELLFFEDPTIRHVGYIRKYGKKTATAIMDHELYAGMQAEAVVESWGPPARKQTSEGAGGAVTEQWAYPTPNASRSRYVYLKNGKVEKWDE